MILNHTLQDAVYSVMERMELPEITQEDIQYAAAPMMRTQSRDPSECRHSIHSRD